METDGLFLLVNLGQKDTGPQGGDTRGPGLALNPSLSLSRLTEPTGTRIQFQSFGGF